MVSYKYYGKLREDVKLRTRW